MNLDKYKFKIIQYFALFSFVGGDGVQEAEAKYFFCVVHHIWFKALLFAARKTARNKTPCNLHNTLLLNHSSKSGPSELERILFHHYSPEGRSYWSRSKIVRSPALFHQRCWSGCCDCTGSAGHLGCRRPIWHGSQSNHYRRCWQCSWCPSWWKFTGTSHHQH